MAEKWDIKKGKDANGKGCEIAETTCKHTGADGKPDCKNMVAYVEYEVSVDRPVSKENGKQDGKKRTNEKSRPKSQTSRTRTTKVYLTCNAGHCFPYDVKIKCEEWACMKNMEKKRTHCPTCMGGSPPVVIDRLE